jgi:hypothetical protein
VQERAKEQKRRADRAALARGERLEDDGSNKPYGEVDEGLQGGIIIPLAPFGIPKYDNGERFDLKARPRVPCCVFLACDPMKWATAGDKVIDSRREVGRHLPHSLCVCCHSFLRLAQQRRRPH